MARNLPGEIDSVLAWRAGGRLLVGRERIALLEAVMEHKSITKAAEVTGFSYKTAWDAVNAINNLLPRPAQRGATGARSLPAPFKRPIPSLHYGSNLQAVPQFEILRCATSRSQGGRESDELRAVLPKNRRFLLGDDP